MAPDAEHLAGASMTARAPHRIEARFLSVRVRRAGGTGPTWRGRVATGRVDACDPRTSVTVDTEELAVTDDAHAGLSRGLLIVNREEVCAVHRLAHRRIECQA